MKSHESRTSKPNRITRIAGWGIATIGALGLSGAALGYYVTTTNAESCVSAPANPACKDQGIDYTDKTAAKAALGRFEDLGIYSSGTVTTGLSIVLLALRDGNMKNDSPNPDPISEPIPVEDGSAIILLSDWRRRPPPYAGAEGGDLAA
jgi:hypothetical protein